MELMDTDLPRFNQTRLLLPSRLHHPIRPGRRALQRTRIHSNHAHHPSRICRHGSRNLLCAARAHPLHDSYRYMLPRPNHLPAQSDHRALRRRFTRQHSRERYDASFCIYNAGIYNADACVCDYMYGKFQSRVEDC